MSTGARRCPFHWAIKQETHKTISTLCHTGVSAQFPSGNLAAHHTGSEPVDLVNGGMISSVPLGRQTDTQEITHQVASHTDSVPVQYTRAERCDRNCLCSACAASAAGVSSDPCPSPPNGQEGSRQTVGLARDGRRRVGGSASPSAASRTDGQLRSPAAYHRCEIGSASQRAASNLVERFAEEWSRVERNRDVTLYVLSEDDRGNTSCDEARLTPVPWRSWLNCSQEGIAEVGVNTGPDMYEAEVPEYVATRSGRTSFEDGTVVSSEAEEVVEVPRYVAAVQGRTACDVGTVDNSSGGNDRDIAGDAGQELGTDTRSTRLSVATASVGSDTALDTDAFTIENIKKAQTADYSIRTMVDLLNQFRAQPPWNQVQNSGEEVRVLWGQYDSLVVQDGVLYHRFYKPDGVVSHLQVVLPPPLRKAYIMHTHCVSGHFGVAKVTAEIAKRVYFPGWKSLTEMVLKTCDVCCRYRRGEAPKQTPLRPVLASRPMDVLQIDLVGPLVEGKKYNGQRGYYYILTAIDVYSKFLFTVPLKNKTAEVVAVALVEILLRVGLSSRIASDLGNEFQAKIICDVNKMLGIEQLRSTSMKPTTQACIERVHRSMHALFAKSDMFKQSEWPEFLPKITLAHNMAVHSSTCYTPYYLFHGREGICPLDLLTEIPADNVPTDVHDFALKLTEHLREAFSYIQKHANTRIERLKRAYDTHVRPKTFTVGQLVYYYYPVSVETNITSGSSTI